MRAMKLMAATVLAPLCIALTACGAADPAPESGQADQAPAGEMGPADGASAADEVAVSPDQAMTSPIDPPANDPIRGKGGLEEKCLKAVADQGTTVIGTNRIEESEAAIAIYVNVEGGQAPWRCLGYKDGTIGEVMYTGSEGGL